MRTHLCLPLLAILAFGTPAHAADWVVAKVSGDAKISMDGKTWEPVTRGQTVPDKAWINTGPRARVQLSRNKDVVTYQPNTLAGVFARRQGGAEKTDFAQSFGQMLLDIEPRKAPHLAVQTPYLAAVVKGTRFSVTVAGAKAEVAVDGRGENGGRGDKGGRGENGGGRGDDD